MSNIPPIRFDESIIYKIVIQGELSADLKEILAPIDSKVQCRNEHEISALIFDIKDQAHLCSILNILYDNRYVILAVAHKRKNRRISE